jgi:ATP:corrinoid adenosyltransferase
MLTGKGKLSSAFGMVARAIGHGWSEFMTINHGIP